MLRAFGPHIERDRPALLVEILPAYGLHLPKRVARQKAIVTFLHELGYRLFRIDHASGGLAALDRIEIHSDLECSDYLALPQ